MLDYGGMVDSLALYTSPVMEKSKNALRPIARAKPNARFVECHQPSLIIMVDCAGARKSLK